MNKMRIILKYVHFLVYTSLCIIFLLFFKRHYLSERGLEFLYQEDKEKGFMFEPLTLKIEFGESMVKQWF